MDLAVNIIVVMLRIGSVSNCAMLWVSGASLGIMLTKQELELIRDQIESEHQKDIEALERLMRFLPRVEMPESTNDQPAALTIEKAAIIVATDPNAGLLDNGARSVLGGLELVLSQNHDRTWTGQQLKKELEAKGYELLAKNPMATIGVALKKLVDRGKIKVVRLGSGREPHIYQWKRHDPAEYESEDLKLES
jgi:hypothetical protein